MTRMTRSVPSPSPSGALTPSRELKADRTFQPCPLVAGDEAFQNGIFEFNITQLVRFLDANPSRFPIEDTAVAEIPDYGGAGLDEDAVRSAPLNRPVLLAEIAPTLFNLFDGHHRVARARREGVKTLPARRVVCPDQVPFLTTTRAYDIYREYWNAKLVALRPESPRRRARRTL